MSMFSKPTSKPTHPSHHEPTHHEKKGKEVMPRDPVEIPTVSGEMTEAVMKEKIEEGIPEA